LAAGNVRAHGQRFIINDGTCTWHEFLTPLVGGDCARWPSMTARELADLHRAARPKWGDELRAVVGNRRLREVVKAPMPAMTVIALRLFADSADPELLVRPKLVFEAPEPPPPLPPIWLSDLFGPTRTRFDSARARAVLGWSPLVKLAEGQDISMHWLAGSKW